jgi:hypothetical protein
MHKRIKIAVVLAVVALAGWLAYVNLYAPDISPDIYCLTDANCVLKQVSCESRCPTTACVNQNWNAYCAGYLQKGTVCSPRLYTGCQCVNKKCVSG